MAKSEKDPLLGTRIREYEILEVIGRGGMGAVYKARHVLLEDERAIKVIHTRLAGDQEFINRFIREARILTRLRHPNLVQLHEFGILDDDVFFMVMEYLSGKSVLTRIEQESRIPADQSIKIIKQAAAGLHTAHLRGIIHRDISPDNLFLMKDEFEGEHVKVIDFGIAKPNFESTAQATATNLFLGKPQYSSPEQCGLLQEGEVIDRRTDIYSLGVTFYYMLTGKLPFYAATPQGYFYKHVNELPRPVSYHFAPGQQPDPQIERIIMKMMAKDRGQRYANMDEVIRDLDRLKQSTLAATIGVEIQESVSDFDPGNTFAKRYQIEKKLGQGGMGSVYKAIDNILNIPVALKIMNTKIADNPDTLERFKREVILARKVAHPNACRIYDIGESNGVHYVSMEFLEGTTLAELLRMQGRLSPEDGVPIIKQVLLALQEAHRVGVIHRDLKPHNILVDFQLRAWIMDFGISTSADLDRVTRTGVLIGTPHYMAPEQFEGTNIDRRTDIYSVGVIMYEIFTGKLPFRGDTPMAIIYAHLKSQPPKPSEMVPDFPKDLESVVLKTIEKEPQSRYQTVRDLIRALEPFDKPTSSHSGAFLREELAHKLIAERSYSKAIQYLKMLLETDPGKTEWKKLLDVALKEQAGRQIRRARSLIRKRNIAQAQLVIDRITRIDPENKKLGKSVKKLREMLTEEREQAIQALLQEAQGLITNRDWAGALARIGAASDIKPDDPAVLEMQQRIQSLQQQDLDRTLRGRLNEIEQMIQPVAKEPEDRLLARIHQASETIEDLLKDHPGLQPALRIKEKIEQVRRNKHEEIHLREKLGSALEPLAATQFDLSLSRLRELRSEITRTNLLSDLDAVARAIQEIATAFAAGNFLLVSEIIEKIQKEQTFWLSPHSGQFQRLKTFSQEAGETNRRFHASFDQGKKNYDEGRWNEAIECWKAALAVFPENDSVNQWIRSAENQLQEEEEKNRSREIERTKFQKTFDRGTKCFNQMQWEEALSSFQEALKLFPQDETVKQWIAAAEGRSQYERTLRNELTSDLNRAQDLFSSKKYGEAKGVLQSYKNAPADYRIDDLKRKFQAFEQKVDAELQKERARSERIKNQLEEAKALHQRGLHRQALQKLDEVCDSGPGLEAVYKLKNEIQEVVQKQFTALYDAGMRSVQNKQWNEALNSFQQLNGIAPDNPQVKQYLNLSAEKSKKWAEVREKLMDISSEVDRLIQKSKWDEAVHACQTALQTASSDFHLEEEQGALQQKLNHALQMRTAVTLEEARRMKDQQKWERAAELYTKVLEWDPKQKEARKELSEISSAAGAPASVSAASKLESAAVIRKLWPVAAVVAVGLLSLIVWWIIPSKEDRVVAAAQQQMQQGQTEVAIKTLSEHVTQNPESEKAANLLRESRSRWIAELLKNGKASYDSGNEQDARNQLARIFSVDSENKEAMELQELWDERAKEASKMRQRQQRLEGLLAEAKEEYQKQDYEKAANVLKDVLNLEPNNKEAKTLLERVRADQEQSVQIAKTQKSVEQQQQTGPRYGKISVNCEPYGRVFIDGKDYGDTPLATRQIEAGRHVIKIRRSGFKEITETVNVRESETINRFYTLEKIL